MEKMTPKELKNLMYDYEIPVVDLAHYTGYSKQYISSLRSGRYEMSYLFQVKLAEFLVKHKGINFIRSAELCKLN